MTIRVIEPPAPILTWDDAKAHLRLDGDDEKEYVESLIIAGQGWFDGPETWLGHSFGLQVLELVSDHWSDRPLPVSPVVEILTIAYRDTDGVEQLFPSEDYQLLASGALWASSWPELGAGRDRISIRLKAGYAPRLVSGEAGGDPEEISTVPVAAVQALKLLVGQWFRTRSAVNIGNIVNEMPFGVEALLSPYRVWR